MFHTSSVTESVEILQVDLLLKRVNFQNVLEELAMDESHKEFAGIDVSESPHRLMEILIQLCDHFGFSKLKEQLSSQTLYSPANDYTTQSEARRFCTHCGDKKVGIGC